MSKKNIPAVSVIIPLFNAEKYLGECLESLHAQTFQNFEVLIVDDCSTDNSLKVAEKFFSKFGDNLKLMKLSRNIGFPGIPRNFALEAARGKYVYFLDSDDLLSATALEELYDVAENFNADVVHVEKCFAFFDADGKSGAEVVSNQAGNFVTAPTLETPDIGKRVNDFIGKKYLWWACNKLFRRKFLSDNKIKFAATKSFEDMIFAFMCVATAKIYVRVPFVSYYYRIRKNSLSHESRDALEMSKTMLEVVSALNNFMDGQKFFRENFQYRYALLDFFIQERLEVIAKNFFVASDLEPAEVFEFFRKNIFSANDNAALTAYLFVAAGLFKLYTNQQAEEIKSLKGVSL